MEIKKYGITLNRLCEDDIELIRVMRNSERIQKFMHYQENITQEMQKKWFQTIDNLDSFYFIIEKDGKKIGLTHGVINNVTNDKVITEGGIFIWEENEYHTHASIACSLIMADLTFYILEIEESKVKVLKSNTKVISYNKKMGYEVYDEDDDVFHLKLTKNKYEKNIKVIRHGLSILTGDKEILSANEISLSTKFRKKLENESKPLENQHLDFLSKLTHKVKL